MKALILKSVALLFPLLTSFCVPVGAQTNYEFSYFNCNPTSCEIEGPAAKNSSVTVTLQSGCTGGIVSTIDTFATAFVANCTVPYIPYAYMQNTSTELYDDTTCSSYWLDYATPNAEVFTAGGVVVWHNAVTYGCDGSTSGPTSIGSKPC